jgi:NAD-dependent deacetylase sirtuin 2
MFGEPLPQRFREFSLADMRNADLVIVMGTSLVVYPFAGLLNEAGALAPRLLLNKQLCGPFQMLQKGSVGAGSSASEGGDEATRKMGGEEHNTGASYRTAASSNMGATSSFRDAAFEGDCDTGVRQLCDALGWRDELEQLVSSFNN